jgi:hypothetical protein
MARGVKFAGLKIYGASTHRFDRTIMGAFTLDADASVPTKGLRANAKCLVIAGVFAVAAFQYGYRFNGLSNLVLITV